MKGGVALGAGLVALYTLMISSADGITKLIAGSYAAPQLFVLSSAIVMALSIGFTRLTSGRGRLREGLRTSAPRAMAIRSGLTVLACIAFFNAFRDLPFADVFLFIGLMPIIAGLLSGPVLGEPVRPQVWAALVAGVIGMLCLMPGGIHGVSTGHIWALTAAVSGTGSMVAARYIGRFETNALAQVFYPNLAIFAAMSLALPFVIAPMGLADLGWAVAYAMFLFAARWVVVIALRLLPAYVATPLMNLQFVWMVAIGALFFGEVPSVGTLLGVGIVIASGVWLLYDQIGTAAKTPATSHGKARPASA
ncbi:DMT family transporter [Primorskyibacter flagellatus]|uniref:EamA-like transporter family protein n=1 Tax=Primorskyibacter flagellatus TaxID=1387277 RepID=A0A1W1YYP2_9RHOB|nr:DMT family transporter [Primorskyibacter flagellatus]SMC41319.1 EamA-like transporter family protein [Primorskyibacter flagellatus]